MASLLSFKVPVVIRDPENSELLWYCTVCRKPVKPASSAHILPKVCSRHKRHPFEATFRFLVYLSPEKYPVAYATLRLGGLEAAWKILRQQFKREGHP